MSASNSPSPADLFARARERHASRDFAAAATLYGQVITAEPSNAEANHLYGMALLELGQYDLGLGFIRRSLSLAPGDATMHFNLGRALVLGGQAEAAVAEFGEAARLRPGFLEALLQRGGVLQSLGRPAEALAAYREAAAADPQSVPAHVGLARQLYTLDAMPEAVAEQEAAAAIDPRVLIDGQIGFARAGAAIEGFAPTARHAAAAALCTGPGGAAAAAARELVIVDDFLPDPRAYREEALALPYTERSARGVNYPGQQTAPRVDAMTMQRIADAAGFDIKWGWPDHGAFRLSPGDARARSDIHVDDAAGRPTFTGLLHLNLPEHCRGGTSFWRHRKTGWERAPSPEELREHGYANLDAFHRSFTPPADTVRFEAAKEGRVAWDLVLEVPMKFNRLILYRADHYHANTEVAGVGPGDGRLVQLFFFERIGR